MAESSRRSAFFAAADLPSEVWDRLERVLERFEDAWRRNERPNLGDFLHTAGAQRRILLLELVHEDLAYRLAAGENARVESYFENYPELGRERADLLVLIAAEYQLRLDKDPSLLPAEYLKRFPQYAEELLPMLQVHALSPAGGDSDTAREQASHKVSGSALTRLLMRAADAYEVPRIPGYDVVGELGRGGMGIVYKARQVKLDRLVALKMILTGSHAGPEELTRFRREAEAVARLRHPHIVQIYEIGEHEGRPFCALEFVDGGSLANKLAGTPLPANEAAALAETLARAVHAAHEQNIIHRDLKPANILLAADGKPKLTDFGLAKRLDVDTAQTRSGAILGTPSYMAPEQASGPSGNVSRLVDVYALGAVLYELLTGRPPFRAANALDTLEQVRSNDPVPLRHLQPKVPRDLETICLKCLQKEPGKRYASASDLADDLQRFLVHEPITARPVGRFERTLRWCRRNPLAAKLAAATVLVLISGVVVAWILALLAATSAVHARKSQQETTRAKENLEIAKNEVDKINHRLEEQLRSSESVLAANTMMIAGSMIGQNSRGLANELLEQVPPPYRGRAWMLLKRQLSGGLFTLYGHGGAVTSVAFSPDGHLLASGCADKTIKLWDARTGLDIGTLRGHGGPITGIAFSPDGQRLASASTDTSIKLWDVRIGREVQTMHGNSQAVQSLAFCPNGLVLASAGTDGSINLWDASSGRVVRTVRGHAGSVESLAFSPDGKLLASASRDHSVKIWDACNGVDIRTLGGGNFVALRNSRCAIPFINNTILGSPIFFAAIWSLPAGHSMPVRSVAFSPDGKVLVSASSDQTLKLWDIQTGEEMCTLTGHKNPVRSVAFSPDGQVLASASDDSTVKLWSRQTRQEFRNLAGHEGEVLNVTFSPSGQVLASASADNTIKVWRAGAEQEMRTLRGYNEPISSVVFSPDGMLLASVSEDKTIRVWNTGINQEKHIPLIDPRTMFLAFSPDGQNLVSGSRDGMVGLRHAQSLQQTYTFRVRQPDGSAVFSLNGWLLAVGGGDGVVKLWDTRSRQEVESLHTSAHAVEHLALGPDSATGRILASVGVGEPIIKLWGVPSEGSQYRGLHTYSRVTCVAFSPGGNVLASASPDYLEKGYTIKLWDLSPEYNRDGDFIGPKAEETHSLSGHTNEVRSLAFSPDGQILASSSADMTIKLWDTRTGREILSIPGVNASSMTFSPDSQVLAAAIVGPDVKPPQIKLGSRPQKRVHEDKSPVDPESFSIKLWDLGAFDVGRSLRGHTAPVTNIAFNLDAGELYAKDSRGRVLGWRTVDGVPLRELAQKIHWFDYHAARSPDGKWVATGNDRGLVYLIPTSVPTPELNFRLFATQVDAGEHAFRAKQFSSGPNTQVNQFAAAFHLGCWLATKREFQSFQGDSFPSLAVLGAGPDPMWVLTSWLCTQQEHRDNMPFPDGMSFIGIFVRQSGQDPTRILLSAKAAADVLRVRRSSIEVADAQVVALYGAACFRAGDFKSAVRELEHALRMLGKRKPAAWICGFLALAYNAVGDRPSAALWRARAAPRQDVSWDERILADLLRSEVEATAKTERP